MPNNFAYLALILWPLLAIGFYKKLPIVHATFWTIVGGILLLPAKTAIDFPLIPPLDKESIPAISALLGCIFIKKVKISLIPKSGIEKWLILVLLTTPFITMINNQETFNYIPGLSMHDTASAIVNQYLFLLPFILGMQLIKTYDDQLVLFKLLVIAGLVYSVPILFEIRMSPQLHAWIYGFHPRTFLQQMRGGGFRAVVFLEHSLFLAMFVAVTLGASALLLKQKIKSFRVSPIIIVIYFFILLSIAKTVGAFLLGTSLALCIIWMPAYMLKRASLFIIFIVVMYPFLSIFELFPHQELIQLATDYNSDRGQSLAFRFYHENILLDHAQKKIFFGWGAWGRNRLVESTTDGYWIILLGQYGLAGFLSLFGLVLLSVYRAIKYSDLLKVTNEQHLLLSHALIVAIIMVDQLPNGSLSAWMMLFMGALLSRANNTKQRKFIRKQR